MIFYNTTNHAWLILNGDTVIDITGDQFSFAGFSDEVYVRRENSFYQNLEDKRILDNYDITQQLIPQNFPKQKRLIWKSTTM